VSIRSVLIVVLALVFGGSAAVGIGKLRGPQTVAVTETVAVVVAAVDVPRFTTISAEMLKTQEYPKDLVPPGALASIADAVGRVSFSPLVMDEPILNGKLAALGAGRGMAAIIPKGMRAFTIQTPSISSSVAGFILPGNKVDVLLTVTGQEAHDANGSRTVTLLQQAEILAVDQRVEAPAENKVDVKELRSVTLLVTPDQASRLNLGQNKGVLHLSLRNPEDQVSANTRRATMSDLGLVDEKPPEPAKVEKPAVRPTPAPKPRPVQIRTLRGAHEGRVIIEPE
jgi:pilus assembly protein CpaB